jgi:predicted nuclease of predicted toxin-antitoxin system
MRFLADENFPRPALEALLKAGWDVVSIAEECPGVPDEDVAALCAAQERILLTFDKDFGELVFHRGLPAGSGVVHVPHHAGFPGGGGGGGRSGWFSLNRILPDGSA